MEIIPNDQGNRITPSYVAWFCLRRLFLFVGLAKRPFRDLFFLGFLSKSKVAFTDDERLIGEAAKNQVRQVYYLFFLKLRCFRLLQLFFFELLGQGYDQPHPDLVRREAFDWTKIQRQHGAEGHQIVAL